MSALSHRDMDEFSLIERYFRRHQPGATDLELGIGDDAAIVRVPADRHLVVSVDTLVAGRHFQRDTAAADIGHKALAVNLSDLAAMGAAPRWWWLALSLPDADAHWLEAFSGGMFALAEQYDMALAGGDLVCGPLVVTMTVAGLVAPDQALCRRGAAAGDAIYVTGTLGAAALALRYQQVPAAPLHRPQPRVEAGRALVGLATACVDISDGLGIDLGQLLTASGVGATLDPAALPLPTTAVDVSGTQLWELAISGGDDYELCFTVPSAREQELPQRLCGIDVQLTRLGYTRRGAGLHWRTRDGACFRPSVAGYRHFG